MQKQIYSNLILRIKNKYFTLLLSICICVFPVAQSALANSNAQGASVFFDFESKGENALPAGWNIMPGHSGRGKAALDEKIKYSGKFSLKLSPGRRNKEEGFGVFTKLDHRMLAGKKVTLQGFGRLEGMGKEPAALLLKTNKENWLVLPQAVQGRFVSFKKSINVSSSISEAYLFFITGGKQGSAWIDQVLISSEPANEHKTLSLLQFDTNPYVKRINTPGWEDSAFISPDGNELYFAYLPYVQKVHRNIIMGRIDEKNVLKKGPIRPGSHSTLEFGTFKSVKNKNNGSWSPPVYCEVEGIKSFYAAKLSFDGKQLYFVIRDHTGGYGSGDIFVSNKKQNGQWGPAVNLGPDVNTEANEDTPCISADGTELYFARNKGDALGFVIMVAKKQHDKWGKAEKVDYPINEFWTSRTANHQPFITADGKEFYFTRIQQIYKSNKNKDGWATPEKVFPDLPVSGHASITADGQYLYFLSVKDEKSLKRDDWSIFFSKRQPGGGWGRPEPVD